MTDKRKRAFWREVGQVFVWSWRDFEEAFEELVGVLEKYGFKAG